MGFKVLQMRHFELGWGHRGVIKYEVKIGLAMGGNKLSILILTRSLSEIHHFERPVEVLKNSNFWRKKRKNFFEKSKVRSAGTNT